MKLPVVLERVRVQASAAPPFVTHSVYVKMDEGDLKPLLDRVVAEFPDVSVGSYPKWMDPSYKTKITFDGQDAPRAMAARDASWRPCRKGRAPSRVGKCTFQGLGRQVLQTNTRGPSDAVAGRREMPRWDARPRRQLGRAGRARHGHGQGHLLEGDDSRQEGRAARCASSGARARAREVLGRPLQPLLDVLGRHVGHRHGVLEDRAHQVPETGMRRFSAKRFSSCSRIAGHARRRTRSFLGFLRTRRSSSHHPGLCLCHVVTPATRGECTSSHPHIAPSYTEE